MARAELVELLQGMVADFSRRDQDSQLLLTEQDAYPETMYATSANPAASYDKPAPILLGKPARLPKPSIWPAPADDAVEVDGAGAADDFAEAADFSARSDTDWLLEQAKDGEVEDDAAEADPPWMLEDDSSNDDDAGFVDEEDEDRTF